MHWLWIDRVVELIPRTRLVALKNVSLAEDHLHDHFAADPARKRAAMPIMPASLIIEGVAQSSGILVGHAEGFREKCVLAKVSKAELDREVLPGQTLRYTVNMVQFDTVGASTLSVVEVMDLGKPSPAWAEIGRIELMFSHIDRNMAGIEFPSHNFVFSDAFRTLLKTSGIAVDF